MIRNLSVVTRDGGDEIPAVLHMSLSCQSYLTMSSHEIDEFSSHSVSCCNNGDNNNDNQGLASSSAKQGDGAKRTSCFQVARFKQRLS